MWLMSLVVAQSLAATDPCEAPRVRDTAPLVAAMAQDRVMGQTFTKAATACAERGEACDQARLECATLLTSTIQKQVGFDEGQWLRDMLLPYIGASYPMTRTFGAAGLASDASCNVDVATLTAAAQRRIAQATRRDAIFQEYGGYARWTQTQLQKCKERAQADEAKNAAAKAESERLLAASSAVTQAEALKQKQAQEAALAKAEAERKAKELADAEAKKQQDAKDLEAKRAQEAKDLEAKRAQDAKDNADREIKRREEAELAAKKERDEERKRSEARQDGLLAQQKKEREDAAAAQKKEREDAEKRAQQAREDAERTRKAEEEKKFVNDRDNRVAQQRALKERLIKDAEDNFKRAKDEEALKKQAAVDAVSSSPAIAAAAVAEAAQAERGRVDAEKRLFTARQQAEAIVIDASFERSNGSLLAAGGGSAIDSGFALGVLAALHFGIWGKAPPEGMASGFELRFWGRYFASVAGTATRSIDSLATARYFFGLFGVGLAGEFRALDPNLGTLRGGVGPSLGLAFIDTHELRVVLNANYLPLGNVIDAARVFGELEIDWKFLTFHVNGGLASRVDAATSTTTLGWQVGGYAGARLGW